MKSFRRYITENASREEQVEAVRNLIVALIKSGAMDDYIASDLLRVEPKKEASTR